MLHRNPQKSDEALDQIIQDDKDNKGQLDGAVDTNISESDLEFKPASGSHDVLIGGALKDETNKAEDMSHLFDDSVDQDILLIATQKYMQWKAHKRVTDLFRPQIPSNITQTASMQIYYF